jgi:uridine kinase
MDSRKKPMFIGITGASGSGKTSIANRIVEHTTDSGLTVLLLQMDSYYKDQQEKTFEERCRTNYDIPEAFEWPLMLKQIDDLLDWQPVEKPLYNFKIHLRETETEYVEPCQVIVFEGILTLYDPHLNDMMDYKLFVDTKLTRCLARRILRDKNERNRSPESVIEQWFSTVEPGFERYTVDTRFYANSNIIWDGSDAKLDVALRPIYLYIQDYFKCE